MSSFARKGKDETVRKMMKDDQNKKIDVSASTKGYDDAKITSTVGLLQTQVSQKNTTLQSYEQAMNQLGTKITSIQSILISFGTFLDKQAQKSQDAIDLTALVNMSAISKDSQHNFITPSPIPDDPVINFLACAKKLLLGLDMWKLA